MEVEEAEVDTEVEEVVEDMEVAEDPMEIVMEATAAMVVAVDTNFFDFVWKIANNSDQQFRSVRFKSSEGSEGKMKGVNITVPPSLPRHYVVKKGCRGDIYLGESDDYDEGDEDKENLVLDTGMIGDRE